MDKNELIELMRFMILALEAMEDDCKIDEYQRTLDQLGEEE
tara:strand:+ start:247 stop:369 length:123 start_codon:yes stop_codon:yes gene_type:complete